MAGVIGTLSKGPGGSSRRASGRFMLLCRLSRGAVTRFVVSTAHQPMAPKPKGRRYDLMSPSKACSINSASRRTSSCRLTLAERPDVKPLTLVLTVPCGEIIDKPPYLGGLSSYGLLLLVLRFLQSQDETLNQVQPEDPAETSQKVPVKLLDFYGRSFDLRNMGISMQGIVEGGVYHARSLAARACRPPLVPTYIRVLLWLGGRTAAQ